MGAAAGIVAAVAALASAGNSIVSSQKQNKANSRAADAQAAQIAAAKASADALTNQSKLDQATADSAGLLARKRAGASTGFGSTILTSPLGTVAPIGGGQKTLLGS